MNIEFDNAGEFGVTFASLDDVEFRYSTRQAHFIYVAEALPKYAAQIDKYAIWAAALPEVSAAQANRSVRWSDGVRVSEGVWTSEQADPKLPATLHAVVYAVQGQNVTHASEYALTFRIGGAFPLPGTACSTSVTLGNIASTAGFSECTNPEAFMGCVAGECRSLCLSNGDCPPGEYCYLQQGLGIRICL